MYTWLLICLTYLHKMKPAAWGRRIKVWIAILLIGIAVGYGNRKPAEIGLLVSIGLVILLSIVTYIVYKMRRSGE